MSLKRQVLNGLFWVSLAQLLGRGLSTVTTLILAYKLGPEALGLVGAATLAINAFQFLQDIGFDAALVYRRGDVDDASHTAFFVVIVSSALICLVAALTAPWAASLLRQPVVPIVRVMSLTMLISGLGRVPYEPRTFLGYACEDACRRHKDGFRWAEQRAVTDARSCETLGRLEAQGCSAYVDASLDAEAAGERWATENEIADPCLCQGAGEPFRAGCMDAAMLPGVGSR